MVLDVRENLLDKIKEGNSYTIFFNSFGQNVIRPTEAVPVDIKLTNEELISAIKQYGSSLYILDTDVNAAQKVRPMSGFSLLNNVYIFDADITVHDDDYHKFDISLGRGTDNPMQITCTYRSNLTYPLGEHLAVVSIFGANNDLGTVWGVIPVKPQGKLPEKPVSQVDLNVGTYEFPASTEEDEETEENNNDSSNAQGQNDNIVNPFI